MAPALPASPSNASFLRQLQHSLDQVGGTTAPDVLQQGIAAHTLLLKRSDCPPTAAACGSYLQWEACPPLRPAIEKTLAMRLRDKVRIGS